MKLLIIGHSVEDHINEEGIEKIKPGGIFYTALSLKSFAEENDKIFLNSAVQKGNYNLFSNVYDNFERSYLKFVDRIPKVYLTLHNFKERGETYESISQGLEINLNDLNMFDGILINMITGFDISLEQIKTLRRAYKGLIYIDIHTLSRGLDENLKREFRTIPNFKEWASSVDILQANESEFKTLSLQKDELEIAKEVLSFGVKYLIITKGAFGAKIFSMNGNEIISTFKSSIKIESKNMIGCGDVFGAVFFYHYIKTKNLDESLTIGNIAAGRAASYKEIKDFSKLKEDVFKRYN
jgi:hypothetical protein